MFSYLFKEAMGHPFRGNQYTPSALDNRLVDYKPDRSLSDKSKITPITTALPSTSHTPYGRVPFLGEMHKQMGIGDPMTIPVSDYMDARKALFKKQPVQDLPLDKMVVTQRFVNTDKIAEGRARGNAAFGDMPIDAVKFQGKHYVMNGHHRAVTAALNGDKTMRARVLDLDAKPISKANPYKDAGGRWSTKDKAKTVTTMEQDMTRQASWLNDRAKELGHDNMDVLAHKDMSKFFELTKKWRRTHAFKLESLLNLMTR